MPAILTLLALPIAAGQSCSDDNGGRVDADAIATACGKLAAAQCSFVATCLPIFLSAQFGDADTCVSRTLHTCAGFANWQGTRWTAEKFDRCAEHVKHTACAEIDTLPTGPCAVPPGSLPSGTRCVDSSQCASGFCDRPILPGGAAACGVCREGGCLASGCKAGQGCIASSAGSRCVEIQTEGTACTEASFCAAGLSCLHSICTKSRGEGEPCTTPSDCDRVQELTCVDKICRKPSIVDIGAACSNAVRCAHGGACQNVPPSDALTCIAPLPDGSPCGRELSTNCTAPARCLSGACVLPNELTCP